MTIEEKAKAYDKALKKAKDMLSYKEVRREDMEYLFPELKESEDERIRKYLKHIIGEWSYDDLFAKGFRKEDIIAWLDRQGKNNMGISETTKQKLEDNLNKALEKETPESLGKFFDEQKPYGQREECLDCQFNYAGECKGSCAMKRGEQILANSAKTCKDEQKPAWSEEDESIINDIEESLIAYKIIVMDNDMELANYIEKEINWLKSLKDRYTWKPSDEQMDAINDAIDYLGGNTKIVRKHLMSLYEQLKKLKG